MAAFRGVFELLRSVDRLLTLEAKHSKALEKLTTDLDDLRARVIRLENREDVVVAEARAAAGGGGSAVAMQSVADMARRSASWKSAAGKLACRHLRPNRLGANLESGARQLATVSVGAIALLVLDGAGWHKSPRLKVPDNIVLLSLPAYSPELNPVENIWEFLRGNYLSHRVFDDYEAILKACAQAWNALMNLPDTITSIATRTWAQVNI